MSRALNRSMATSNRFPRVSGDEPHAEVNGLKLEAFSPRERG